MIRDNASQAQVNAADPELNTWLSANAGSGKTRVLTDRVARLLLNGVDPQNILCLTYTKAAASEMQNRLFKRLGAWSMLEDDALARDLSLLGEDQNSSLNATRNARRLFARAIETPGGLKIQTIHSFCANILRQFPLEAGVSPQFKELDEAAAKQLRNETLDSISEADDNDALRNLIVNHAVSDLDGLTASIASNRKHFLEPLDDQALLSLLELKPTTSQISLVDTTFDPTALDVLRNLSVALTTGSTNDKKAHALLSKIDLDAPKYSDLSVLEKVFLTGSSAAEPFTAKIAGFPTKAVQKNHPEIIPALHDLMLDVEQGREQRLGLQVFERTNDFHAFANRFATQYEENKLAQGVLDFDDLILKTRSLLEDPVVSQWVLFRLDGGIDHLLVDEAQDTSPEQWAIVRALTDEFASGASSREDLRRTIFVVGDKKQSIYSFQGADPKEFDRMQSHFDTSLNDAKSALKSPSLQYSFRSSAAILRVVDEVFVRERAESIGNDALHLAFKENLPGRVDLWDSIESAEEPEPDSKWFEPVDRVSDAHHNVQLAKKIASEIKRLIAEETLPVSEDGGETFNRRKITEGDFLILVQRRSDLFSEIIRACKVADLKVAGADRLELKAELAVKDIIAVLNFLALPEDSMSLANALRSPLFSWSEQELFTLAHHRKEKHLWHALRNSTNRPETLEILNDLRSHSDFLRPFELIDRLLTRHNGRKNLIARLGQEASEGIDAILAQAINYEHSSVPSLTGFLCWLDTFSAEVKRQIDNQSDQIRIMTIHGAKGLEAPIVILPDTAKRPNPLRDSVIDVGDCKVWKPVSDDVPNSISGSLDQLKQKHADERLRLLYVAMTRAENWLIVAAAGKLGSGDESWYNIVSAGLEHAGAGVAPSGEQNVLRFDHGDWNQGEIIDVRATTQLKGPPIDIKAIETKEPAPTITPSNLGGEKIIQSADLTSDPNASLAKGRIVHTLLEHLPKFTADKQLSAGNRILDRHEDREFGDENLVQSVVELIQDAAFDWIFAEDTLAEVEIISTVEELDGVQMNGIIDRLIVTDDVVSVVDFKTNLIVPDNVKDTTEGILRQMGLYAAALKRIYPNHEIRTAILWTEKRELAYLPLALVSAALNRVNGP